MINVVWASPLRQLDTQQSPGFASGRLQVGQRTPSVADTSGTGKGEVFAFDFGQNGLCKNNKQPLIVYFIKKLRSV
jgi:hypothetical protein